jgi:hypothetical protein
MHQRNTGPMLASPRCGAKTRAGPPCLAPALKSKRRCRMHGGGPGSGAPQGNTNALKTGLHTRELKTRRRAERQKMRSLLRHARDLIEQARRKPQRVKRTDQDELGLAQKTNGECSQ